MIRSYLFIFILLSCIPFWVYPQCDPTVVSLAFEKAIPVPNDCLNNLPRLLGDDADQIKYTISTWTKTIIHSSADVMQKHEYFDDVMRCCERYTPAKFMLSSVYYEKGKWQYGQLDDLSSARKSFSIAFDLEKEKTSADSTFMSKSLSAIGACQYYNGDIQSSEKTIKKLIEEKWPISQKSLASNLKTLGLIYRSKGNIPLAEKYFYQSGINYAVVYGDSIHFIDHALNSIGLLYYYYSYYDKSIEVFERALNLLKERKRTDSKSIKLANAIHNNLANAFVRVHQYDDAQNEYESILNANEKINDTIGIISTLLNIGSLSMKKGDLPKSDEIYDQVSKMLSRHDNESYSKLLLDHTAQLHRLKKNYSASFVVRKKQIKTLTQLEFSELFNQSWTNATPSHLINLRKILPKISLIYRDRYRDNKKVSDLDSALLMLTITQSILDQIKQNQLDPDFSADLGALNADLLEDGLSLYEDKPDWTNHYYTFFEKAKSASLLAAMQSSDSESLLRDKYPEIQKVHKIKLAIDSIQDLLDNNDEVSSTSLYSDEILQLNQELVRANGIKQKLLISKNELNNLYDHVELEVLQKSIDDENCMISYFMNQAKDELFILYITNNHIELFNKKVYPQFTEDLFRLVNMPTRSDEERAAWIASNNRISELLISDVLPRTPNRLNIIPDGILAYLPFEMLLTREVNSSESYVQLPYLIKDKIISYNFSASIWKEMSDKKTTGKGLLTMAPEFSMTTYGLSNSNNESTIPLAHARKEVAAINSIFNSKYQPTTKIEFINQTADAQIVHFAGHAILNDNKPDNSYLAFSSNDDREDKLFIRDIYNMRTPNELVVLSACNTGQGELKKGEGVMSMARAFAYSGAKSLVYSLWDVNDGSTKKIMERFYEELKAGSSKDHALRTAKLAYLDRAKGAMQQPFYWAGFVAMGDMTPIVSGRINWIYVVGMFLGLGLLILLYRRLV